MTEEKKISCRAVALFTLVFMALATVHVAVYLNGEHHLYVSDFRNYWIAYWKSGIQFKLSIFEWARNLREGIWASDYNSLPAALLLPFSLLMGYERFGYIWGSTITYLVPVALLSAKAAGLVVRDDHQPTATYLLWATIAAFYTPFWAPTLLGWVDIVGLIPFSLAFILMRTTGFGVRVKPGMAIVLGVLLWMPFLFRRWYAFSIVALVLTAPIYCMVLARIERQSSWGRALITTSINFAIAGSTALAFCLMAQGGLVKAILSTSYSEIYVAYQRPALDHFRDLWSNFGGFYLLLAFIGLGFIFRSPLKRTDALFVGANVFVLFALFTRTQGFGIHHYLPLAFWIYLLICMGVWQIISLVSISPQRAVVGVSAAAILLLILTFYRTGVGTDFAGVIFPRAVFNNQVGDEEAYKRLAYKLDQLVKPNETFTVFASDLILNRDVLLSISDEALAGRAVDTSHVDLIQGLSVAPFMTRYAVVSDPVLTHLPNGTQTVITVPARAILSGKGIGAAYKRVGGSYPITPNVNAFIYEKTRPFTPDEIDSLLAEFYKRYPDWERIYGNPMFKLAMTSTVHVGDQWGKFDYLPGGTLSIHPGETTPTGSVFSGVSTELDLSVAAACPGSDGVDVRLSENGKEIAHLSVAPSAAARLHTTDASAIYELVVSKRANPWCDLVSVVGVTPTPSR